ncbi:ArgS-related anticodon-binding protein NrtL [Streptomyces sp. SP18CS02]|uniref:ArgS-related anticodon-binding protein NrtL n=1 Tax=Streptomyces sp. SP18CS02 TaxID=3002531 RepID=UPI002E77075B|nr:DALR anticodon-binding domain-containing protein [Streptomyces sp. SP18CS02]MEE1757195.1 DALR anticodon-binding domain-containing protein [Streptomyces sp. SP18CS02]
MTPADLSLTVLRAVRRAVDEGVLRADPPERIKVERPRAGGRGDWATSAALQLARTAALPPRRVAEILQARLDGAPGVERVEITGPGFLNFTLHAASHAELVRRVLREGLRYGHGRSLAAADPVTFAPGRDPRAVVVTETVVALLRAQGARAGTAPGGARELRPLPAPGLSGAGADAVRWAFLRPGPHDRALDPASLLAQTEANPLFTVRYAHSRARALVRNAAQLGFGAAYDTDVDAPALLTALGDHPAVLEAAARHSAPDRVARQLEALADALLGFQHTVLPRGDEKPSAAHRSRLALAEAAGTVLAGGLALLGISAPDYL